MFVSFRKQSRWKLPIMGKLERASIKATRCILSTLRVLEPKSVASASIFDFISMTTSFVYIFCLFRKDFLLQFAHLF